MLGGVSVARVLLVFPPSIDAELCGFCTVAVTVAVRICVCTIVTVVKDNELEIVCDVPASALFASSELP